MSVTVDVPACGATLTLSVLAKGKWRVEDAWLQCVPDYVLREGLLRVNDASPAKEEMAVFETFCSAFANGRPFGWLGMDAFRAARSRALALVNLVSRVESHEIPRLVTPESARKEREEAKQRDAAKKRALLRSLVTTFEEVRDSNAALINTVYVKSANAVTAVRHLSSPVSQETGARAILRGPYGVRIPAMLPSNGTAARQMEGIGATVDEMYEEDAELGVQYAPLVKVIAKMVASSHASRGTDEIYSLVIVDHLDALKVTSKCKRTPCSLWGLSSKLWPTGASAMVRWFDFEGGVHRVKDFNKWRVNELNRVLNQVITVDGLHLRVDLWYVVGDNERLQIEAGGNTGSSPCRCAFCFLPAELFDILPRHGEHRSLHSGAQMWTQLEEACVRIDNLSLLGTVSAKVRGPTLSPCAKDAW